MFGKEHDLPRLQQWFGDPGLVYRWSGIDMAPEPWSAAIAEVKAKVEKYSGVQFNTVLLNRYRDGSDTVAWHADDEEGLGTRPTIGSVSLGAERDFLLRHNERTDFNNVTIPLPHGSLLIMAGPTQAHWKHCIPRRKRVDGERINLTFRQMQPLKRLNSSDAGPIVDHPWHNDGTGPLCADLIGEGDDCRPCLQPRSAHARVFGYQEYVAWDKAGRRRFVP